MVLENRSEIVLLYDARDTNPNGDPLAANNPPRVDSQTNQAVVTDVRLKRYIRDELFQEGHNIFVKSSSQIYGDDFEEGAASRAELVNDILEDLDYEEIAEADSKEVFDSFLNTATDVRYFGATFSTKGDVAAEMPSSITGPVQFGYGRSLNPVSLNTESKKQSTVVASGEGKGQGTFAYDNRLHYALISFGGVINERLAEKANLTQEDVDRLDSIIWNSILNQTTTRSKVGQTPRFYARIEYNENTQKFAGSIDSTFSMDSEKSLESIRTISEYSINIDEFVNKIKAVQDKINKIVLQVDPSVTFKYNNETYSSSKLEDILPVTVDKT